VNKKLDLEDVFSDKEINWEEVKINADGEEWVGWTYTKEKGGKDNEDREKQ
jgi:hypothetical protein